MQENMRWGWTARRREQEMEVDSMEKKEDAVTRVDIGDRIKAKPLAASSNSVNKALPHEGECQEMNGNKSRKADGINGPRQTNETGRTRGTQRRIWMDPTVI